MSDATPPKPVVNKVTRADLRDALALGWADFRATPQWGLLFASACIVAGLIMALVVLVTGQVYWMAIMVFGFPLIGPFAAVGLYEVSHRRAQGAAMTPGAVLGVVWRQKDGQLPWLCAIIIFIFLFWSFIGHMIFALFLGLTTMTNISSSYEVFLSPNGIAMLVFGGVVGAALAGVVFAITVVGLPLLLDREVDFVTAMITSVQVVRQNPAAMLRWALLITVLLFVAMVPAFLGLLVALPVLGHASWHLYTRAVT